MVLEDGGWSWVGDHLYEGWLCGNKVALWWQNMVICSLRVLNSDFIGRIHPIVCLIGLNNDSDVLLLALLVCRRNAEPMLAYSSNWFHSTEMRWRLRY